MHRASPGPRRKLRCPRCLTGGMDTMGARLWRRSTLAAAVVALTVVAATSLAGQAGAQTAGDGLIPEGDWTEAQVTYLVDLIHRTEATLPAKFPTVASDDELA